MEKAPILLLLINHTGKPTLCTICEHKHTLDPTILLLDTGLAKICAYMYQKARTFQIALFVINQHRSQPKCPSVVTEGRIL